MLKDHQLTIVSMASRGITHQKQRGAAERPVIAISLRPTRRPTSPAGKVFEEPRNQLLRKGFVQSDRTDPSSEVLSSSVYVMPVRSTYLERGHVGSSHNTLDLADKASKLLGHDHYFLHRLVVDRAVCYRRFNGEAREKKCCRGCPLNGNSTLCQSTCSPTMFKCFFTMSIG